MACLPRPASRGVSARGLSAAIAAVKASQTPLAAFAALPEATRRQIAGTAEGWAWLTATMLSVQKPADDEAGLLPSSIDPCDPAPQPTSEAHAPLSEPLSLQHADPANGMATFTDREGDPGCHDLWLERAVMAQIGQHPDRGAGWLVYKTFLQRSGQHRKLAAIAALSRRERAKETGAADPANASAPASGIEETGTEPPRRGARAADQSVSPVIGEGIVCASTQADAAGGDRDRGKYLGRSGPKGTLSRAGPDTGNSAPSTGLPSDEGRGAKPQSWRERPKSAASADTTSPRRDAECDGRRSDPGPAAPSAPSSVPASDHPARASHQRKRPSDPTGVTVIVPVYGDARSLAACLAALSETEASMPWRALAIDDASPDPDVAQVLRNHAGWLPSHRLSENRGYIGAVAAGLSHVPDGDVILLNSDCIVPGGDWIDRLAAHAGAGVGTVTPLASNGQSFGFPVPFGAAPAFTGPRLARIDAAARQCNAGRATRMLTSVGYCSLITRACLDALGGFSAPGLTAGYGEEVDFCLRAAERGFAHLAATDCYVTHLGAASFKAAKRRLVTQNEAVLRRRYPTYLAALAAQAEADPLRPARARIERALISAEARMGGVALIGRDAARLAKHPDAWDALAQGAPLRLIEVDALTRPAITARLSSPGLLYPQNLTYRLPLEATTLAADLARLGDPDVLCEPDLLPQAAAWLDGTQVRPLAAPAQTDQDAVLPPELAAGLDPENYAGLYL